MKPEEEKMVLVEVKGSTPRLWGWLARKLRLLADRLDSYGAFRRTSASFTFEAGRGMVLRWDGQGCPLWYAGKDDYGRAFAEADQPAVYRLPSSSGYHVVIEDDTVLNFGEIR